jgi:hypothetical protein
LETSAAGATDLAAIILFTSISIGLEFVFNGMGIFSIY